MVPANEKSSVVRAVEGLWQLCWPLTSSAVNAGILRRVGHWELLSPPLHVPYPWLLTFLVPSCRWMSQFCWSLEKVKPKRVLCEVS